MSLLKRLEHGATIAPAHPTIERRQPGSTANPPRRRRCNLRQLRPSSLGRVKRRLISADPSTASTRSMRVGIAEESLPTRSSAGTCDTGRKAPVRGLAADVVAGRRAVLIDYRHWIMVNGPRIYWRKGRLLLKRRAVCDDDHVRRHRASSHPGPPRRRGQPDRGQPAARWLARKRHHPPSR